MKKRGNQKNFPRKFLGCRKLPDSKESGFQCLRHKKNNYSENKIFLIPTRYLILLGLVFSLPLFYKILTPLTIYPVAWLLKLFFSNVSLSDAVINMDNRVRIEIVSACVAGSAYLLILILNLAVPMKTKKRFYSILLSLLILFGINVLRIFFFSILYYEEFAFFDISHKLFWYALSTFFVVGIWFLNVRIFSIKEIPVYSDIVDLIKNIKKKP